MRWINRIIGAGLIAASIYLWQAAESFPEGARIFPRFVLAVIALLSAAMIIRSLVPAVALIGEGEGERTASALVRPLAAFSVTIVAVAAAGQIGFFPAMAALVLLLWPLLQVQNWRRYLIAGVLLLAFVYVVFVLVLNVPLTSVRLMSM